MQTSRNNNVAYYVSIVLVILFFFGCTVEQTHKSLLFFFDGVDKVIFFNDYLSKDSLGQAAANKREALLKKNRPDLCVHKPYKEKKCEECHTPDKRLVMPMPGLCFKCHQNFSEVNKVVHGPVASGSCLNCHNQHSSKYAKLLIRQGQQICLFCHNSSQVFAEKVHRDIEDAECILCHNPHGGKTRLMLKDNISRDANRIGLMDELSYRHLYGQIFCKVPGDVNRITEIYIVDDNGTVMATAHPDLSGKFYLANLHPDRNYTFRFKNDIPDCKISIMDNNGTVLYILEKSKKGKYIFDKTGYESVHTLINDAHYLGDTLRSTVILKDNAAFPVDNLPATAENKENKLVGPMPETITTQTIIEPSLSKDTVNSVQPAANAVAEPVPGKGKIIVKELPAKTTEEAKPATNEKVGENVVVDTVTVSRKGKIIYKPLNDQDTREVPGTHQTKIEVAPAKKSKNRGTPEEIRKYEIDGVTFTDLTSQIARFYDGTVVCVLNDSADYLDIAPVNANGGFLLYDFLSYKLTLPGSGSGIISQAIFLNEKMEVIEVINKRIVNGRYIYIPNRKETGTNKAVIKIFANKENAALFSTIYFEPAKTILSAEGIAELNRVVDYLRKNHHSRVYLAAHSDSREAIGYSRQLSEKRAVAAIDFLVSKGIKRSRVSSKGYGKNKQPVTEGVNPKTEEENRKNRRVDVYIKDY